MKKLIKLIFLAGFIFTGYASAFEYLMPKETLKNPLSVYSCTSSTTCDVVGKAKQGTALKVLEHGEATSRWRFVDFTVDGEYVSGFVYSGSVTKYKPQLNFAEEIVAKNISFFLVKKGQLTEVHILTNGKCYVMPAHKVYELPEGLYNAKTLYKLLEETGGLSDLTDEQETNCGFQ